MTRPTLLTPLTIVVLALLMTVRPGGLAGCFMSETQIVAALPPQPVRDTVISAPHEQKRSALIRDDAPQPSVRWEQGERINDNFQRALDYLKQKDRP